MPGLLGAWNPSPSHFVEQLRSLKADDFVSFAVVGGGICYLWGWEFHSVAIS